MTVADYNHFLVNWQSSISSCFRWSFVIKGRMLDPREKLYLSSSLLYHMFIAARSFMLSPALGWMLCIVAANTVFKLLIADSINCCDLLVAPPTWIVLQASAECRRSMLYWLTSCRWKSNSIYNLTFIFRTDVNINNQGAITNNLSDVVWQFNDSNILVPLLVVEYSIELFIHKKWGKLFKIPKKAKIWLRSPPETPV